MKMVDKDSKYFLNFHAVMTDLEITIAALRAIVKESSDHVSITIAEETLKTIDATIYKMEK